MQKCLISTSQLFPLCTNNVIIEMYKCRNIVDRVIKHHLSLLTMGENTNFRSECARRQMALKLISCQLTTTTPIKPESKIYCRGDYPIKKLLESWKLHSSNEPKIRVIDGSKYVTITPSNFFVYGY